LLIFIREAREGNLPINIAYQVTPLQNQMSQVLINATCFAAAFDTAGNLYCGNQNGTLTMTPVNEATVKLAALGFFPVGMAIDNARGLIYVSGGTANKIAVYNLKGVRLTTIE
jgi:hypothetical protein